MRRNTVLAIMLLLVSLALSACAPAARGGQTPECLDDMGKTLGELKREHPEGECMVRFDGFPGEAAVCFGEPGAEYAFYFFGTQGGDGEKAMAEGEDRLICAGVVTTAGVLFPDMEDDMSFEAFFALIGVDDYEYLSGEEVITGEGWLSFPYHDMDVMVNTNEAVAGGGWQFTGAERVSRSAPASIVDPERSDANGDWAATVLFD